MDYSQYIKEVIPKYPFTDPLAEFIRHNENITYKVTEKDSQDEFLIRIHRPISKNMQGMQNKREAIQSELDFLFAWSSDSKLPVQIPFHNLDDELVTTVVINDEEMLCSVLKWIPGNQMIKKDFSNMEMVRALGEQIAYLHQFSRGLSHRLSFIRPEYGIEWVSTMLNQLEVGKEQKVIQAEEFEILENAFEAAINHMDGIDKSIQTWGFTHGDIHDSNLIRTSEGISFIDFGLSGFGYFVMDLAMAALFIPKESRYDLLSAYEGIYRKNIEIDQIELFMLLSICGYYAFIVSREDKHKWIREHIPNLIENICKPYLKGETFFYKI